MNIIDNEDNDLKLVETENKDYIGYEYKEILLNNEKAAEYLDGLLNFGWIIHEQLVASNDVNNKTLVKGNGHHDKIILKRNRKIINKVELIRLQRNFEACLDAINGMEKSINRYATLTAIIMGLIGTVFMAGSTFAIVADEPNVTLCVFLAIPAFTFWILPYFIYKKTLVKRRAKVVPFIEAKYDEIDNICAKGPKILSE